MSILTKAIHDLLAADVTLTDMLALYEALPAIFTIDPVPGDAVLPYIVTSGEISQVPFDTKLSQGRNLIRDVRCYTPDSGSSVLIESIAERVYFLLHRKEISISGFQWLISNCTGPIVANEQDVYGRIISLNLIAQAI